MLQVGHGGCQLVLDAYEQEIEDGLEKVDYKSVLSEKDKKAWVEVAKNHAE